MCEQNFDIADVEPPRCYLNWCIIEAECLLSKEEIGVHVNVRIAGEDGVSYNFVKFRVALNMVLLVTRC